MIINVDSPEAHRILVFKEGRRVGLVQELNTETKTMKRYNLQALRDWASGDGSEPEFIVETYDELREMDA